MSDKHPLIGKTIVAIFLSEDGHAIRFDVEGEPPIVAVTNGDCCSVTWIEHVEDPDAVVGHLVLDTRDIELPDLQADHPEDKDREVVAYYGFKIVTANGTCTIDFRNESNGYYGGSLTWSRDDHYYGGVFGQNKPKEPIAWKRLTKEQQQS